MAELNERVTALENIMLPIARIFDLNDASLRVPNHYGDWLATKAKEHSYYQNWTQLDKRSLDYLYARLEAVHLLMKASWAMSKTWDYQSDNLDLRKLDGLDWWNYRKAMPNFKKWEFMLVQEINRRLKNGEKTIHFEAYEPKMSEVPENINDPNLDLGFY